MRICDVTEKRRRIWQERNDIEYDRKFCEAAARKILTDAELKREVWEKPYLLIEAVFQIVNKDRQTEPFFLNEVQRDFIAVFEENGTARPYFILKGRQQGFTSLITAMQLCFAIVRRNFSGFTLAHRQDTIGMIFNDKARSVLLRLPELLKPSQKFNSKNELFFDKLNSAWRVAVASPHIGRGNTLNFVHFSEVALYECDLSEVQAGIGEAIAAGAIQIYETTANGFNQAKELWDGGSCHNVFYEWWRTAEYRSREYEYLDKTDSWLAERKKLLFSLGLDREQVTWYCKKYHGYIDKQMIRQEYPITPAEAFISTGECVFDRELILARLAELKLDVGRLGYFEYDRRCVPVKDERGEVVGDEWFIDNIRFRESADGYIRLHEEPQTRLDREGNVTGLAPYVIGGDTSDTGEDFFTAKVISVMDGHCAATLHRQRMDEELYAEQLYCLGKYYHDAMIAVEINYSRHPVRVLRAKYRYGNLYLRRRVDGVADLVERDYGFETNRRTKPVIIAELAALFRERPEIECDIETLHEMLTFVKKENGRQEAIVGKHDDLVMASAIAHFAATGIDARWRDVGDGERDFLADNFTREDAGEQEYMDW